LIQLVLFLIIVNCIIIYAKQMPRRTKRKTNHASISEDVMTAYSVMKWKMIRRNM